MAENTLQNGDPPEAEQFNTVAKSGWNFFTKFLLVNVIVAVVSLLVIGAFTVWS